MHQLCEINLTSANDEEERHVDDAVAIHEVRNEASKSNNT